MANSKISALPSATTPLAGTEVLPVVQGGITEQVSVANLTAGRSVAASNLAVDANSATAAVRITQLGAGNALLVEDSASPDSTPFVIDAAGNVIQGTTASTTGGISGQTYQQHVTSAINGSGALFAGWNATQPNSVNIARSTSGTIGSFTTSPSGTASGIKFFFDDGTAFIRGASIDAAVDGTAGTNDMPGRLVFSTTADGGTVPTERMRIDSAGLVGIGTTAPAARLHLAGAITASSWTTNGISLRVAAATYTDSSTAASGTVASAGINAIAQPTIAATNATVTYTNAATVYIANSPANGTNVTVTNALSLWVDNGTTRLDGNITYGGLQATQAAAPTVASSATIAPTTPIAFVSGITTINTITAPAPISSGGGQITLIPTGLWSTGISGNIALATIAVVSKALIMTYDTTTAKWYPSY